jgi:hypothetical protein
MSDTTRSPWWRSWQCCFFVRKFLSHHPAAMADLILDISDAFRRCGVREVNRFEGYP